MLHVCPELYKASQYDTFTVTVFYILYHSFSSHAIQMQGIQSF